MFKADLETLLTNADEANNLFRSLIESIGSQGGNIAHLNLVLKDAKGARKLLDAFAREAIGNIWKLAFRTIDIGPVDFGCPAEDFLEKYPQVDVQPGSTPYQGSGWSENAPGRSVGYHLFHSSTPVRISEVFAWEKAGIVEHAGWRELVAYAAKLVELGLLNLSTCAILGAGSPWLFNGHNPQSNLPRINDGPASPVHLPPFDAPRGGTYRDELLLSRSLLLLAVDDRRVAPRIRECHFFI